MWLQEQSLSYTKGDGYSAQKEWTAFDNFKENTSFIGGRKGELQDQVQNAEGN